MGNSRVREKWVRAHDGNLNYFILGVKSHPLKGDYRKAVRQPDTKKYK